MSSTSPDAKERLAREFWDRELKPLAAATAAGTRRYFPGGPDPALASYYVRREKTRFTAADFEAQSVDSPERLGAALAAFWAGAGNPELAALAPGFAALAARVYDVDAQAEGVTPFMYVMF